MIKIWHVLQQFSFSQELNLVFWLRFLCFAFKNCCHSKFFRANLTPNFDSELTKSTILTFFTKFCFFGEIWSQNLTLSKLSEIWNWTFVFPKWYELWYYDPKIICMVLYIMSIMSQNPKCHLPYIEYFEKFKEIHNGVILMWD